MPDAITDTPAFAALNNQPLPTAFHIMTKPIGPICNLDCRYCFYLEKETLYSGPSKRPTWQMSDEVLESYIRQYIEQQDIPEISFAWQGGEPTLLGVRFFEKVVALQQKYAAGKVIQNALQTNGTLLDDNWAVFLAEHGFLVGLSIDGPQKLHDAYRVDKQGQPSFDNVMRGLQALQKRKVEFNTLTVVNRLNSRQPLEVYRFLKQIGSQFHQYIPLVERSPTVVVPGGLTLAPPPGSDEELEAAVTNWSVTPGDYGSFLIQIFDEWVRNDVARIFVQTFDVALGIWAGAGAALCVFQPTCGKAMAMEHNGDVYSCDHYVYPNYLLGNIRDKSLKEIALSPAQQKFGADKTDTLPAYCRECDVKFACNGECPKHRFLKTPTGEAGLNYLCAGYQRFFRHVDPYMKTMTRLLEKKQPPAAIMQMLVEASVRQRSTGRNDPCPCGSGKKFKQCCLQRALPEE